MANNTPTPRQRKQYDPQLYASLTAELLQILQQTPHLVPSRDDWDLEGDWNRTGTVHFIDSRYQPSFKAFADFDCRTIKLINLDKPAIRITFYAVHKYYVIKTKDMSPDGKIDRIHDYINTLIYNIETLKERLTKMNAVKHTEALGKLAALRGELQLWNQIAEQPDAYDLAQSNYHQDHIYTNINYKYAQSEFEFDNKQEHLLTTTYDALGNVVQLKHNIVFVDTEHILRNHPYQNKTIERYLNQFHIKSSFNRDHLFARLASSTDLIESFEKSTTPSPIVENTSTLSQTQNRTKSQNHMVSDVSEPPLPTNTQFNLFDNSIEQNRA